MVLTHFRLIIVLPFCFSVSKWPMISNHYEHQKWSGWELFLQTLRYTVSPNSVSCHWQKKVRSLNICIRPLFTAFLRLAIITHRQEKNWSNVAQMLPETWNATMEVCIIKLPCVFWIHISSKSTKLIWTWSFKGWNLKRCWKEEWSLRSKHSQFTHCLSCQRFTSLLRFAVR